jgi:glycosyltransferase involved in cell wall biosynthesis
MTNDNKNKIAVIVPIKNESDNIKPLIDEINTALSSETDFEIIYIDDGSDDDSLHILQSLKQTMPHLRIIQHASSCGQSAAIRSGIMYAKNGIIVTLDGDGQNVPADIPALVAQLRSAPDSVAMVAGQRLVRNDSVSKKYASKIANKIRGSILNDGVRDTGCGIKAFRKDAYLQLPYFDHMHRYFAALFKRENYAILLCDVAHRHRVTGTSKYGNWGRFKVGIVDLCGVLWLLKRRKSTHSIKEIF